VQAVQYKEMCFLRAAETVTFQDLAYWPDFQQRRTVPVKLLLSLNVHFMTGKSNGKEDCKVSKIRETGGAASV
jgi:hypothetical protein